MNKRHIFTTLDTNFGKKIEFWINEQHLQIEDIKSLGDSLVSQVDGLVFFHENHDITKSNQEIVSLFEAKQKAISKIDINGTLMVAISNFSLWLDIHKCKTIAIVGSDKLIDNINLERFLEKIKL
jgi:hypothetical protein